MKKKGDTAEAFQATTTPATSQPMSEAEWRDLFDPFSAMCARNPITASADADRATRDLQDKGYTL